MDTLQNTQSTEKSVLRFHLALANKGKAVRTLHTGKIGRIHWLIKNREWDHAHLKVTYGNDDLVNEGYYVSVEELQAALGAFTEIELREYVGQG